MTDSLTLGISGSIVASLGTLLGSLAVLAIPRLAEKTEVVLLSAAAGIMLAATFTSLIMGAIEMGTVQYASVLIANVAVGAGVVAGALGIYLLHRLTPHEHFRIGLEGGDPSRVSRTWLFVLAITLHNFPEGLAVGVSFAEGTMASGAALTTGIFIQNIPEGLAVAVALVAVGYGRWQAATIGMLSGLVEPVGGLLGAVAVSFVDALVPFALAVAAGAMLFVVSDEIIPETHRGKFSDAATFALVGGVVFMVAMDSLF